MSTPTWKSCHINELTRVTLPGMACLSYLNRVQSARSLFDRAKGTRDGLHYRIQPSFWVAFRDGLWSCCTSVSRGIGTGPEAAPFASAFWRACASKAAMSVRGM